MKQNCSTQQEQGRQYFLPHHKENATSKICDYSNLRASLQKTNRPLHCVELEKAPVWTEDGHTAEFDSLLVENTKRESRDIYSALSFIKWGSQQ